MVAKPPNGVRDARVSALLTQEQLAEKAGVDTSTIVRAERGEGISYLSKERIARALGLGRRDLFPEEVA
jgi:transcriptional regulator with XRE-family HTH domain